MNLPSPGTCSWCRCRRRSAPRRPSASAGCGTPFPRGRSESSACQPRVPGTRALPPPTQARLPPACGTQRKSARPSLRSLHRAASSGCGGQRRARTAASPRQASCLPRGSAQTRRPGARSKALPPRSPDRGPAPPLTPHVDGEATARTDDRILSSGQGQDRAAIRTEIQVRLKAGAGAGAVHGGHAVECWKGNDQFVSTPESRTLPTQGASLVCPRT